LVQWLDLHCWRFATSGTPALKNDVEQGRETFPICSVTPAFDQECEIIGNDAFDDDVDAQRGTDDSGRVTISLLDRSVLFSAIPGIT
jgi:hypothetical protein